MPLPTLEGVWNHNSYLVLPNDDEVAAIPKPGETPIPVTCIKWAKGTLNVAVGDTCKGELTFPNGLSLVVSFTLNENDNQVVFLAQGEALSGPIAGTVYELAGWASLDDLGEIKEVSGGIRAKKGMNAKPGFEPGGAPVGTTGYFRLTRNVG